MIHIIDATINNQSVTTEQLYQLIRKDILHHLYQYHPLLHKLDQIQSKQTIAATEQDFLHAKDPLQIESNNSKQFYRHKLTLKHHRGRNHPSPVSPYEKRKIQAFSTFFTRNQGKILNFQTTTTNSTTTTNISKLFQSIKKKKNFEKKNFEKNFENQKKILILKKKKILKSKKKT